MEDLLIGDTLVAKSDQLNADDIIGKEITVRVTGVRRSDTAEQPVIVEIDGGWRPWKPCKTMRRVLAHAWGENAREWIGRSLVLYRDSSVRFGSDEVGGIRIRAMSHIPSRITIALSATKGKKAKHTVEVFRPPAPAVMDLDVFRRWLGHGITKQGWKKDEVAALLKKHGGDDKAESVPEGKRAEIAKLMEAPPPAPPAEEPPEGEGQESWK
jgi:hypothetical protein